MNKEASLAQREIINRKPWKRLITRQHQFPLLITIAMLITSTIIFIVLIGALLALFIDFSNGAIPSIVFYIALAVALLCLVLMITFIVLRYRSIQYVVEPGKLLKTNEKLLDQLSGRVKIISDFLGYTERVLTLAELDRTIIKQSVLGQMFNYGNIYLEQVDRLTQTDDFILKNVPHPVNVAHAIQELIDIEADQTQQLPPSQ